MNLLVLPIILPLLLACLLLIWRKPSYARRLTTLGIAALTLVVSLYILSLTSGIRTQSFPPQSLADLFGIQSGQRLVLYFGGWAAPYGIVLTVDILSSIMTTLSSFVGLICIFYSFSRTTIQQENPLRLPLFSFMLAGIHMSFATGDLFNLYVSFEVMLIASYALMTLESDNYHIKQNFNYVTINLVASTLFLLGAALMYGYVGTLNFAQIAEIFYIQIFI